MIAGLGEIGLLAVALAGSAAPWGEGGGVASMGCGFPFRPERNDKHIGGGGL